MSKRSAVPEDEPDVRHVRRPWGAFEQYAHDEPTTVSLMTVEPGRRLSLQAHEGRAELWVVLDDGAEVQVGERILHPAPGDTVWIPARTRHRLSSIGPSVRVLEIAFGEWRQEDIVRFDDDYARPAEGE